MKKLFTGLTDWFQKIFQTKETGESAQSIPKTDFLNASASFESTCAEKALFELCGHAGTTEFIVNMYGNTQGGKLREDQICDKDGVQTVSDLLCPSCMFDMLLKNTIRCCLCGYGILPGESVALYSLASDGIKKEVATVIENSAIGCLRWDCCPSGGFFAGKWTSNGFEPSFNGNTLVGEVLRTGKPIVKNL